MVLRRLRKFLVAGIVVSLPAFVTLYLLYIGFRLLDGVMAAVTSRLVGRTIPGIGLVLMLVLLTLLGAFTTRVIGKRAVQWVDHLFESVPLVRSAYSTVRQLVGVFVSKGASGFKGVVMIEYPRPGLYSLGFVTGSSDVRTDALFADLVHVFVPTTPNPTTGTFVLVPRSDVAYLEMSVEQGLTMIISAGAAAPGPLIQSREA